MAKRRVKKRTHRKVAEEELAKIPRSMVLHLGQLLHNHLLTQLVRDFRTVMQPHTAIKLRERKLNKLKDFVVMAGPLGVTDLFVFNQLEETGNVLLRMAKVPHGPTLQFRINAYSLVKDVARILKRPKSVGVDAAEFHTPPLLVLNGFGNSVNDMPHQDKLMVTMFQNMFPPIQPQLTTVSSIKRVLMINRNDDGSIDLRHYAIDTKLVEESRNIKKLLAAKKVHKKIPNLSRNVDVLELVLDPYSVGGVTLDLEVEDDAIVEINQQQQQEVKAATAPVTDSAASASTKKRAIKLTELGPRLNMNLVKIEEGVGEGKTLYHSLITKLELEQKALDKKHERRKQLRAQRRAEQKKNVEEKLKKKQEKKERRKQRQAAANGEGGDDGDDVASGDDAGLGLDLDEVDIKAEDYENDSDLYSE